MGQVATDDVLELNPLEIIPDAFIRVQLRRIAGKSLKQDALCSTVCQKVFDPSAPMNGRTVPYDQYLPRDVTQQMLEKANHVWAFEGTCLHHRVQLALWRDATDSGQMIMGQTTLDDGRLSNWRIGAHDHGQQVESRFINKDYGVSVRFGFF